MFHMKKRILATVLAAGMLALAQPNVDAAPANGVNWSTGVISVIGEGVGPAGTSGAKRRLLAKRAAVVDGYRKLAEVVQGVTITSETRVKELEVESDEIRASVTGLVKGAQIIEENVTSDGAYEVRIDLPLYGENSLASAVLATSLNRRRTPAVDPSETTSVGSPLITSQGLKAPSGEAYSGVIVDARNLKVKAAMMPALFDEGDRELYFGNLQISNDDLVAQGPVSYAKSLDDAKAHPRVGSNPLIVRAKRFKGPFQADLTLAEGEATRLMAANQAGGFLKNMAVVIVQ